MRSVKVLITIFFAAAGLQCYPQSPGSGFGATDALGRKLPTYEEVGDLKKDKFVGLFY